MYKKACPVHKVKLYFPQDIKAVIGHNRLTTQGSEDKNYNNHPFEGKTDNHGFSLAHNGILYNDKELKFTHNLPDTAIETDSYVAVQLLERHKSLDIEAVKSMAEKVCGSFVFTILRDDNTLFLVRGNNPITLYHFPELGLYLYASTKEILDTALKKAKFQYQYEQSHIDYGEIAEIDANGNIQISNFERYQNYYFDRCGWYDYYSEFPETSDITDEIELLRLWGYSDDEIDELLLDDEIFQQEVEYIKMTLNW